MGDSRGPGLVGGAVLLGIFIWAAVRLSDMQPWGAIALGFAIAHFLLGLSWTMSYSGFWGARHYLTQLWVLTIPAGVGLLIYSFVR